MNNFQRLTGFSIMLVALSAIGAIQPSELHAQTFFGSVVGTVSDASGAVVPGASVTLTNLGTNEAVKVRTDASGNYSVFNLVPADYRVTVERAGFKRYVREKAPVQVGATSRIDASLAVGNANETVEVTTAAPLLQTDSSSLNQEVEGAQVEQMPLNGRNVLNLLLLAPSVIANGAASGATGLSQQADRTSGGEGWGNYQIGGAIQGQAAFFVDGAPDNNLGNNSVGLVPTQDAVQEFSVISNVATADFGRYGGGVVNMTTRSGSNAFHGTAYEYNRNTDYGANAWFNNQAGIPRNEWDQNQYGAGVNGPIKRDRAFFMFTWEGFREVIGAPNSTNVPSVAMQNGVFPTKTIKDPLGACNIQPYTGQTVNGQTFPSGGTYITNLYGPALANTHGITTCGDPLNEIIKTFWPAPNSTNPADNWYLSVPIGDAQNQYNGRVDYQISPKQRLFARYSYWSLADTHSSEFNDQGFGGTTWATEKAQQSIYTQQAVLGDTYTLNPTTVLDVRLDYSRQWNPLIPGQVNASEAQFDQYNPNKYYTALASQMSLHTLPEETASGSDNLYNMSSQSNYSAYWYNNYGFSASLVKIVGSHTIKTGADLRLMDMSGGVVNNAAGYYSYSSTFNGDEFASILMGEPILMRFQTFSEAVGYEYYQAYFVTDAWQANRKLTLNLGLRYELPGAIAERNNKMTVLLPNAVDPYTGITGTEALVASPLWAPRGIMQSHDELFAPRVGFAYRASNNTVVHGGYGISYLPNDLSGSYGAGVAPYNSIVNSEYTSVTIPTTGSPVQLQTPLGCIAGAISGSTCTSLGVLKAGIYPTPGRSNPGFMTQYGSLTAYLGQSITAPDPYQPYPYTQQWNLALSREFKGNFMAEVGYAGLHGANLPGLGGFSNDGFSLDELSSRFYSLGASVLEAKTGSAIATAAGFATCPNAPGFAAGAITVGQCLRPNPYYSNMLDSDKNVGVQSYKSVQVTAEKRFSSAGVIKANYVWSKNMSDADTELQSLERGSGPAANYIPLIQDYNNLGGEYSLIGFDVKNRAVIDYLLNLPFGKGQKYGSSFGYAGNAILSGWAIDGITTFQSGFPIFLVASTTNQLTSAFGAGQLRPNVVPGCNKKISGGSQTRVLAGAWFNTSCFVYPSSTGDSAGAVTFGNEPRVDPDLREDGIKNFDLSLQKSTPIHESTSFVFRAEFFNIMNRVQFDAPNNAQGSAGFGQCTLQVNNPRMMQFSGRIDF